MVRQPALPSSRLRHARQRPQQKQGSQHQLARMAEQTEHPGRPAVRTCGLPAAPALLELGSWPSNRVNTFSSRACRAAAHTAKTGARLADMTGARCGQLPRQHVLLAGSAVVLTQLQPTAPLAAAYQKVPSDAVATNRSMPADYPTLPQQRPLTRKWPPTNTKSVPGRPAPGPPLAPDAAGQVGGVRVQLS